MHGEHRRVHVVIVEIDLVAWLDLADVERLAGAYHLLLLRLDAVEGFIEVFADVRKADRSLEMILLAQLSELIVHFLHLLACLFKQLHRFGIGSRSTLTR